ncbi:SMI1/KNR4 family protein [Streptomyces venezuelae]|uniref:SMI1/KNR4 family protein n=1 Tax=Streptomyces venezuelae TaxID=54571 RepID=A0A5P2D1M5_STRVZ|nr:SMI1/KNR4 family protein [Streptomyces venezuelae]QES47938.1 SMI1/KNR4 family protein [Streptomyces venezuelae]
MIETTGEDRRFPPALAEVATVEFVYGDSAEVEGEGVDFMPYAEFEPAEETTQWVRAWTANHELDGGAGQDGSGGLAALWMARPGRPLAEQPVVFMGSEGESGLVAANLSDLLWVLADGFGPREAALHPDREPLPDPVLAEIAARHAVTPRRAAREIVLTARAEFPSFEEDLDELCR